MSFFQSFIIYLFEGPRLFDNTRSTLNDGVHPKLSHMVCALYLKFLTYIVLDSAGL